MRHVLALLLFTAAGATALAVNAGSQTAPVHPSKQAYADRETWPATSPGSVSLQSFRPFRAVYERHYLQASGARAGEPRTDEVIVSAEEVGWDGLEAVSIHLLDSGVPDQPDTNARTLTMFVARGDLRLLFEIGPSPGSAKDYYVARVLPDRVVGSLIETGTPALTPKVVETPAPGFGPSAWVVANMPLAPGLRFRLSPSYSPQANPLSQSTFGRVVGRETFTDLNGDLHEAWAVETVTNMTNERGYRYYVTNRPPYYLGTASWDLSTDTERNKYVWLKRFQ